MKNAVINLVAFFFGQSRGSASGGEVPDPVRLLFCNFTGKSRPMTTQELAQLSKKVCKNTLMETLDIEFTEVGDDYLVARMPVTPKVHQPDGVLHGGATMALAESVGSLASYVFLDRKDVFVRGIEISGNHLRSVRDGYVYAKATAIHKGRTTQLWEIKVTDQEGHLVSLIKLTNISLPNKK